MFLGLICRSMPSVTLTHSAVLGTVFAMETNIAAVEYSPYLVVVVLMLAAVAFAFTPLLLARLWARFFSPQKPGPDKNATYECGLESKGDAWVQFRSEYYLYAIIFLIFDVETIFLLPFAVAFTGLGVGAFLSLMVFLFLLVAGLLWAWKKGVLTWR